MSAEKIIQQIFGTHSNDNIPIISKKGKSRDLLPVLFKELGFSYGAEIGVFRGAFSKHMFDTIPDLKLLCVDMWIDCGNSKGVDAYKTATNILNGSNSEIMKMSSIEASNLVKDNSLDFVYIDASHDFDSVITDIIKWSKKVKVGGVISGHDYHPNFQYGVIEAVNAYTKCHGIDKFYITREIKAPSWFWVKK